MIAPNGPMKFCAGLFGDETWLNQIQEGTSFGVKEISARKSSVPTPRRIRAKTSFHALLFTERATAAHTNAAMFPFNDEGETAERATPNLELCERRRIRS